MKERLAELLRYHTTASGSEMISLKDYITRMKEGQSEIYYLTGESRTALLASPFLEKLLKKGFEVILMTDPMDEYAMQQLKEFEGKKFKNVTQENLDTSLTEEEKQKAAELSSANENLCRVVKEILGEAVEKVITWQRIVESPCCIVTSEYGWSAYMERLMKAQALRNANMSSFMVAKKTLEINPEHPIMIELRNRVEKDQNDKTVRDLVWLLFQTSLLTSGFTLEDPTGLASRIHRMIKLGLSITDEGISERLEDEDLPGLEEDTGGGEMETVD
jgi:molecular chaperone HtpG